MTDPWASQKAPQGRTPPTFLFLGFTCQRAADRTPGRPEIQPTKNRHSRDRPKTFLRRPRRPSRPRRWRRGFSRPRSPCQRHFRTFFRSRTARNFHRNFNQLSTKTNGSGTCAPLMQALN